MTGVFTSSIAPFGRWSSWEQPIVGTLNCMSGVRALTSAPESLANGANGSPAFGLLERSTGPVSFAAAAQTAGPTFFSTSARLICSSPVAGVLAAGALADADAEGVGVGALTTSPPPWPPLDAPGFAAGALPFAAGALAPVEGFAPALGLALGVAAGGFMAVCATSPVTPTSSRNRICAAWDRSFNWSSALPASET